ncbi:MAG TPA: type II 3-dehydroquinate dehydratase [Phnomibacter sp.]|nr:type II 3-dehydroquinate dehydratase [Phnomibacter sp.]
MKIAIINGPNLNLLGKREPDVYGQLSFEEFFDQLVAKYPDISFVHHQTNVEGELINFLHQEGFDADGIILNPGGYTHTSVALGDAIAGIKAKVIEVHISNTAAREPFRHISHVSAKSAGTITGLGLLGYELAVIWFKDRQKD